MGETAPPSTPPRSRSIGAAAARWTWALATVLLVALAGLITWDVTGRPPLAQEHQRGPGEVAATSPTKLAAGHDYYVHVKIIELTATQPGGKAWDSVGDSGPDIMFTLTWRENRIWKSGEKSDTLIGSWDLLKVDLKQLLTSGGQTDLEGLINAPLVHYNPGEWVELLVWDEDTVGSDNAGTIPLLLDNLTPGDNTITPALGKDMAVKRVVLSMIDRRTPLPELVETISKR